MPPAAALEEGGTLEIDDGPSVERGHFKESLQRVVPAVVVLKVTLTRAVDTEAASSAYATGFVVDKARGILLTNRHVITPGPIVAEAIFLNREETPVYPLYYDPVHDFGFLRFDPSKITFMEISEVPLAPEAASVGLDIRVVGNDSGEKVSILSGVLARLDRDAPVYGRKGYNDFNTFYLQAASGTKGGSSGSPVIDCQGRAVGLNAGGKNKAASAYYLPLERVVRALRIIQGSKDIGSPPNQWTAPVIPRGDIQTTFLFKGFDEVRRLGLRQETEAAVRAAPGRTHGNAASGDEGLCSTGMLVVEQVLPGGPADGVLEAGDVLVKVNGEIVTHFLHLEEIMDTRVGKEVTVQFERGGKQMEAKLVVADIHSVTPYSFLEVSGGTVQALSYQQARNNRVQCGQVYVAEPGYMLGRAAIPRHAIITALGSIATPTLESFASVLRGLPHGARVPVEYYTFQERYRRKNAIMHMDRDWYGPPLHWVRDDAAGCWHPTSDWPRGTSDPPASPALPLPALEANEGDKLPNGHTEPAAQNGIVETLATTGGRGSTRGKAKAAATAVIPASESIHRNLETSGETLDSKLEERLRCSMVLVDVDIPLVALADGVHARSFAGNGLIVHHGEKIGLVLVDRNTVTVGPCDVTLSFGAHPTETPGTVRFLHPLLNFALVSYDPKQLPEEARRKVVAADLMPHPPVRRGDTAHLAGLTKFLRIMQRKSTITTATSAITIPMPEVPRFRAVHEEVIKLDQDFGATFSGVLTDENARIRALWGSYAEQVDKEEREWCSGLPTDAFYPWVQRLLTLEQDVHTEPPFVRTLDAELEPLLLSKAAQFKLPVEWITRLDQLDPERRQVLRVRSTVANSHASKVLKSGDMLLAIAGKPVSCFRDIEAIISEHNIGNSSAAAVDNGTDKQGAKAGAGQKGGRKRKQELAATAEAGTPSPAKSRRRGDRGSASATAANASADVDTAAAVVGTGAPMQEMAEAVAANGHTDNTAAVDATGQEAVTALSLTPPGPIVPITIFRSGQIQEVEVRLGQEDGMGTNRLVHWCGAQLQAPHRAVRELGFLPEAAGVYISRWHHGSPAHRYGLYALHWISEVNGHPTPDLDTFLEVVKLLQDGDFVRLKILHLETAQPKVLTLKMDLTYWPTWELRLHKPTCTWKRICINSPHVPKQQQQQPANQLTDKPAQ